MLFFYSVKSDVWCSVLYNLINDDWCSIYRPEERCQKESIFYGKIGSTEKKRPVLACHLKAKDRLQKHNGFEIRSSWENLFH